jgi:hypothetical protein
VYCHYHGNELEAREKRREIKKQGTIWTQVLKENANYRCLYAVDIMLRVLPINFLLLSGPILLCFVTVGNKFIGQTCDNVKKCEVYEERNYVTSERFDSWVGTEKYFVSK